MNTFVFRTIETISYVEKKILEKNSLKPIQFKETVAWISVHYNDHNFE